MGSGLSMASVNKIKELANSREYSLALDIVDSQDLSKSLNPQFLRLCGEIYTETGRCKDARRILIMAHRLAPEAKRVIYSFVYLYLKTGYYDLAKTYYDLYLFDAEEDSEETNQLKYIYGKAKKVELEELEPYLSPYVHRLDYDWSYELYLLYVLLGKTKDAENLSEEYLATFKNSDNSRKMQQIQDGELDVKEAFYVFAKESVEDDDPEQEELRVEESKLLEADDLRIHPKDPEITIMVDDWDEPEVGSKRKLKKFLKEQERQQRKEQKAAEKAEGDAENAEGEDSEAELQEDGKEKKGLFKKGLFKKKKQENEPNTDSDDSEIAETQQSQEPEEPQEVEEQPEMEMTQSEVEKVEAEEPQVEIKQAEAEEPQAEIEQAEMAEPQAEIEQVEAEEPQTETEEAEPAQGESETVQPSETESIKEEEAQKTDETIVDSGDLDMQEIHLKRQDSNYETVVSIDFDDDFTAESDTIEGLRDDIENPFESISAMKQEKEEPRFTPKKKEFFFEDAEIAPLDEDETEPIFEEIDESIVEPEPLFEEITELFGEDAVKESFAESTEVAEDEVTENPIEDSVEKFDEMFYESEQETILEDISESFSEEVMEETVEEPADIEENEITEEPIEELAEKSSDTFFESEPEPIFEEITENEPEPIFEEITESEPELIFEEITESEPEPIFEEITESEPEPLFEEITESEPEPLFEEITESEPEPLFEEITESEPEPIFEEITESEPVEKSVDIGEDEIKEEPIEEPADRFGDTFFESEPEPVFDNVRTTIPVKKNKMDFPVFRSSLFPTYNNKVHEVENNFNEIMSDAQDKMQESMLKEEQMQKEAEALLASLGIDLGNIVATADSYDKLNATLYEGPSRDELKASLKIDSVKRDILRKLKEHR